LEKLQKELSFFDFIELMKENNLELYQYFKHTSSFKTSAFFNSLDNVQKQSIKEDLETTYNIYLKSNSVN